MYKIYELLSEMPAQTASKRIAALLSSEGVEYTVSDNSIVSEATPIVLLGIQRRLYTRNNWIGINPFAFVSGINVQFCESEGEPTKITVCINRRRAILFVAFWTACSYLAARAMPGWASLLVLVGVACVSWLGIVSFFGGGLIMQEINNQLKATLVQ